MRSTVATILFLFAISESWAASPESHYWVVDHIKVESQDASAVSAREKALIGGQRQAFLKLLSLLSISAEARTRLTQTKDSEILPLIFDFSVQDELLAPGSYRALLRYRFPKEAVAQWLKKKHVSLQDSSSSSETTSPLEKALTEAFGPEESTPLPPRAHRERQDNAVEEEVFVEIPVGRLMRWFSIAQRLEGLPHRLHAFSQNWIVLRVSPDFLKEKDTLKSRGFLLKSLEGTWRLLCSGED
ncbi:MAG: hypothetical protein LBJ70_03900 [Holosporales bacterium]|jgi:hypothetical protein|nr:hypothetical protein [Holosporales bacterium]